VREDLKEMITQVDELDVWHFQETLNLCDSLNTSHWQHTHAAYAGGDMEDHEYIEALADQNVRTAGDVHYIWQLGVWRLQAIFEGLIDQDLLRDSNIRGHRRKLNRLTELGFSISPEERRELDNWAGLRNALSHRPVYATSLSQQVYRDDLAELANLYTKLIERWRGERDRITAPIQTILTAVDTSEQEGC
jgi:hypothetical protein